MFFTTRTLRVIFLFFWGIKVSSFTIWVYLVLFLLQDDHGTWIELWSFFCCPDALWAVGWCINKWFGWLLFKSLWKIWAWTFGYLLVLVNQWICAEIGTSPNMRLETGSCWFTEFSVTVQATILCEQELRGHFLLLIRWGFCELRCS